MRNRLRAGKLSLGGRAQRAPATSARAGSGWTRERACSPGAGEGSPHRHVPRRARRRSSSSLDATVRIARWEGDAEPIPDPLRQSAARLQDNLGAATRLAAGRFVGAPAVVNISDAIKEAIQEPRRGVRRLPQARRRRARGARRGRDGPRRRARTRQGLAAASLGIDPPACGERSARRSVQSFAQGRHKAGHVLPRTSRGVLRSSDAHRVDRDGIGWRGPPSDPGFQACWKEARRPAGARFRPEVLTSSLGEATCQEDPKPWRADLGVQHHEPTSAGATRWSTTCRASACTSPSRWPRAPIRTGSANGSYRSSAESQRIGREAFAVTEPRYEPGRVPCVRSRSPGRRQEPSSHGFPTLDWDAIAEALRNVRAI